MLSVFLNISFCPYAPVCCISKTNIPPHLTSSPTKNPVTVNHQNQIHFYLETRERGTEERKEECNMPKQMNGNNNHSRGCRRMPRYSGKLNMVCLTLSSAQFPLWLQKAYVHIYSSCYQTGIAIAVLVIGKYWGGKYPKLQSCR